MGEKKAPSVFYHLQCDALAGAKRQYDFNVEISDDLFSSESVFRRARGGAFLSKKTEEERIESVVQP